MNIAGLGCSVGKSSQTVCAPMDHAFENSLWSDPLSDQGREAEIARAKETSGFSPPEAGVVVPEVAQPSASVPPLDSVPLVAVVAPVLQFCQGMPCATLGQLSEVAGAVAPPVSKCVPARERKKNQKKKGEGRDATRDAVSSDDYDDQRGYFYP
jgi:hypothetical protein